ncbi:MAG: polysaccharide deacetylase family protein [Oscillospiraceae bacterium]|nr:polysaccharide deacetylase family protein [Oscillospiraceae bacterium]
MKKLTALLLVAALLCVVAGAEGRVAGGERSANKYVALTFDDGPTGELTAQLLDGLRERYVSATFFLCGYRAEEYPALVRRMAEEGHELAIHGWRHAYLHTMAQAEIREELKGTGELIAGLTGVRPKLFRPPGGLCSETVMEEAAQEGLSAILWSVDPEDWSTHDAGAVVRRVQKKARDGDILLMHDLSPSSVTAALRLIDQMTAQGYQFCTVSELAAIRGKRLEAGEKYYKFPKETEA